MATPVPTNYLEEDFEESAPVIESERKEEVIDDFAIVYEAAKTWINSDTETLDIMANCLYGEARGLSPMEQSAVVWCILNRVDAGYGDIKQVVTKPKQFTGYKADRVYKSESAKLTYERCKEIVIDVYCRWRAEGVTGESRGRTLPKNYLWFYGDGKHNHFRDAYKSKEAHFWNWSCENPYENI